MTCERARDCFGIDYSIRVSHRESTNHRDQHRWQIFGAESQVDGKHGVHSVSAARTESPREDNVFEK